MRWLIAILMLLFMVLQYDLWVGEGSVATVWRLHQAVAAQQRENARLAERNRALEAEVRDLKQGLDALEERARTDLGMIRQGETFFRVVDVE